MSCAWCGRLDEALAPGRLLLVEAPFTPEQLELVTPVQPQGKKALYRVAVLCRPLMTGASPLWRPQLAAPAVY